MGDIIYHIDGNGVNFHVNGNLNDTTTLGNTTTYDGTITNENTLDVATPIIKDHVFLNNSVNLDTGDYGDVVNYGDISLNYKTDYDYGDTSLNYKTTEPALRPLTLPFTCAKTLRRTGPNPLPNGARELENNRAVEFNYLA